MRSKLFITTALVAVVGSALVAVTLEDAQAGQLVELGMLAIVVLAIWMTVRRQDQTQRATMRRFADANGWEYVDKHRVERKSLPVADAFVQSRVNMRYQVSGETGGKKFQLYTIVGLVPGGGRAGWGMRTVLEPEGSEPQILRGNAVSREDLEEMFRAAGL